MTGALNTLAGDSIAGATGLLTGNIGQIIVFGGAVLIIALIIGVFFYLVGKARTR